MNWREVAVTVSSEGEEAVADLFYQLGCPGVSVEDPELISHYIESGIWDYHAFGEIRLTGTSVIKGYLCEGEEMEERLVRLEAGLRQLLQDNPEWVVQAKGVTVKEEDWASAWKAYFKPVRVGTFLIKPTWEEADPQPGDVLLELDPGMAFGTGTHPTTTLCLKKLGEMIRPGQKVYDLGTGSGILAIAAAKMGAEVEGIDLDPVAVQVAQENVELNQAGGQVRIRQGDLGTLLEGPADVVVANIIADVIIMLLADLPRLLRTDGEFLASGIIDSRAEEVEVAMGRAGLTVVERVEDAGWVLLRARWAQGASL